jgi:hypothetical protein
MSVKYAGQSIWSLLIVMVVAMLPAGAFAGSTTRPSTTTAPNEVFQPSSAGNDLTGLSLEDLMNVEVTSVAKEPQKISDAPAGVAGRFASSWVRYCCGYRVAFARAGQARQDCRRPATALMANK